MKESLMWYFNMTSVVVDQYYELKFCPKNFTVRKPIKFALTGQMFKWCLSIQLKVAAIWTHCNFPLCFGSSEVTGCDYIVLIRALGAWPLVIM